MSFQLSIMKPDNKTIHKEHECQDLAELAELSCNYIWAPACFKGTRSNSNANYCELIVLDIDAGLSVSDCVAQLNKLGLRYAISASKSHGIKKGDFAPCDRFRVMLQLSEPITNDADFKATWRALNEHFPESDPACKDIARQYYPSKEVLAVDLVGRTWPVTRAEPKSAESLRARTLAGGGNISRLTKRTKQFLLEGAAPGTQHNATVEAALDMKACGFTKEQASERIRAAFEVNGFAFDNHAEKQVADIFEKREATFAKHYPDLIPMKNGDFKPDPNAPKNWEHFFENVMDWKPTWNMLTGSIFLDRELKIPMTDVDHKLARVRAAEEGFRASKDVVKDQLYTIAIQHRAHPLKDAIEGAPFVEGALDQLIDTITFNYEYGLEGAESEGAQCKRYRSYMKKWFVGCMAKLYRPGSQNMMLVFQGATATGKSRWFDRLEIWPSSIRQGEILPESKDHVLGHLQHLIWVVPELDGVTRKKDVAMLKDFLTKTLISERGAFKEERTHGQSICSFAGATNSDDFLRDMTGNRRYMVVPILKCDFDHDVPVLSAFKEAKVLLENGYQYWLSAEELEIMTRAQDTWMAPSEIVQVIRSFKKGTYEWTALEILQEILGIDHPSSWELSECQAALRKYGFKRKQAWIKRDDGSVWRPLVYGLDRKNDKNRLLEAVRRPENPEKG